MVRLEGGAEEAAEGWFHQANVAVCRTRSGESRWSDEQGKRVIECDPVKVTFGPPPSSPSLARSIDIRARDHKPRPRAKTETPLTL